MKKSIQIKAYTMKGLCLLYGTSYKTLRKSIKPLQDQLGERIGYYYNPRQVRIIFSNLGIPCKVPVEL